MKTVAIVQVRMKSTRLPGKVMLPLADTNVLGVVVKRLQAAKRVDEVVVATSLSMADVEIERWTVKNRIGCFRGSETDVLSRVTAAAESFRADIVVDITSDCPLVDPRHVDKLVGVVAGDRGSIKSNAYGYASNCVIRDWPDGLDIQVATMDTLHVINKSSTSVREHVLWNCTQQAEALKINMHHWCAPKKYARPEWGLTLDEPADYELLKHLFRDMTLLHGDMLFPVESALDFLLENPGMLAINADVKRKVPGNG